MVMNFTMNRWVWNLGKVIGYLHTEDHSAVTVKHRLVAELALEHTLTIKEGVIHMMLRAGGPSLMLFAGLGVRQMTTVALVGGVLQHLFWARIT